MTMRRPPRLALWLLERFVPDSGPLAGDLLEQFQTSRSRLWFWLQVLLAIGLHASGEPREIRPLKLVEHPSYNPAPRAGATAPPRPINLTASPLHGVGGLGLLALAILVSLVQPAAWWGVLLSVVAGLTWGVVRILLTRHAGPPPTGGNGRVLFVEQQDDAGGERPPPGPLLLQAPRRLSPVDHRG